ncbi:DUF6089 family protein [Roseivirga sp. BDSF3-8]|uniref:type IX secretion system protein PorG n=1 Tax=Roseivirga sp. BDSF3-8 TaxID=3241598 RepID=UPI0035323B4F
MVLFCTILSGGTVSGQGLDVGIGVGGLTYTGDLSPNYTFSDNQPGGMVFVRRNMSEAVSIRVSMLGGSMKASDEDAYDIYAENRNAAFDIGILEGSVVIEYNFLPYKTSDLVNLSPYLFAGIGGFVFWGEEESNAEYSNTQLMIPFGGGVKYLINPKWTIGAEFGARTTFFDYLDNVSDNAQNLKNFTGGNSHDNDWYYFLGLTLSYSFYTVPCPFDAN